MTLITAYGKNGKIFSLWRVATLRRKFRFHKGDRFIAEIEVRHPGIGMCPLDFKARDIRKGHQPLIDGLLKYLNYK